MTNLFGEIIAVGECTAICWLDVSPGSRVRTEVPLEKLTGISLMPHRRFAIQSDASTGHPRFAPLQRDPALDARFDEMSHTFQQWHSSQTLPNDFVEQ
jgi:hypothetical protein